MAKIYWAYNSSNTTLTLSNDSVSGTKSGSFNDPTSWTSGSDVPWYSVRSNITTVNFASAITMTKISYLFCGCSSLTTITNPANFTFSNAESARFAFWNCSSLVTFPQAWTVPASLTNTYKMFYGCSALTGLIKFDATPADITETFYGTSANIHLFGSSGNLPAISATATNGNVDYYEPPTVSLTGSRNDITQTTINLTITATKKSWTTYNAVVLKENGTAVTISGSGGTWTATLTSRGENNSYTYVATVTDRVSYNGSNIVLNQTPAEVTLTIGTGFKTINIRSGGKSIGFGTAAPATSASNGLMTVAMDLDLKGGFKVNGVTGDVVIEYGTSTSSVTGCSGWTWRKWASGKVEAFATVTQQCKLNNSNGGWYASTSGGFATADFPSGLFTSSPMRFATARHRDGSNNAIAIIYNGNGTTNFGSILFARGNSNTSNYTYIADLYAVQV